MSLFLHILTNEHENEHDLASKPLYTEPKIYDAKGDLSKRWYVYYSFRNPETDKLVRQPNIYKGVNKYTTKAERMEILTKYLKGMRILLKAGYSPYEEKKLSKQRLRALLKIKANTGNTARDLVNILSINNDSNKPTVINNQENNANKTQDINQIDTTIYRNSQQIKNKSFTTAEKALAHALKVKKPSWSSGSAPTMEGHYNAFIKWLKENNLNKINIREIETRHISLFLQQLKARKGKNQPLTDASNTTKNNHRSTLSTLFTQLKIDKFIDQNIIKETQKLKQKPKKHKSYSDKLVKDIREHLDKNDPYLRVFIQFMSYAFLRNKEVCNIKVKNIDLTAKKIYVPTKTKAFQVIPIIKEVEQIIRKMEIHKYDPDDYLITKFGHPNRWDSSEKTRTSYFSKRFVRVVRRPLGLDENYTLYSFRHTAALNLYKSFKNDGFNHHEILLKLMPITRHSSKDGLENYLRDIGATLPEDYGDIYTIEF